MIEITKELNIALQNAQANARLWRHEYLTIEHIFHALLQNPNIIRILEACGGDILRLKIQIDKYFKKHLQIMEDKNHIPTDTVALSRLIEKTVAHVKGSQRNAVEISDVLAAILEEKSYSTQIMNAQGITRLNVLEYITDNKILTGRKEESQENIIEKYCTNLSLLAKEGKIDPVIGREEEILRCMEVLLRRKKNNPLLIGEPGVGKTAVAEGLATTLNDKKNPLFGMQIYALNMGALLAGTKYRGDFEKRIKELSDEIIKQKNIILFIDEIHMLVGAGATSGGTMDASNLLKPMLSSGKMRCIGASTYAEYRNLFDKDKALSRRFDKIDIDEPSEEKAILILQGLKKYYEKFHNVHFSDEVIKLAVELSSRYLHDRFLPDKAIDVLDQVGASYKLQGKSGKVSEASIKKMVAKMAKIPEIEATKDDVSLLKNLQSTLKRRIFGQDLAISEVVTALKRNKAGLSTPNKPIGSFLFSGPSGVGKTQLAKELAKALNINFERIDMSEYMEKYSSSGLIGAPAGYVGYEKGGILTEMIKKNPHTLLLLDEIEKAHPDVLNIFLQVMDNAKLTDNNGQSSDFSSVILIMTSNVGSKEAPTLGFGTDLSTKFNNAIKDYFTPEFRNRLDAIVPFSTLSQKEILKIVDKGINDLNEQIKEKNVKITLKPKAKEYLAKKGFDLELGARPLNLVIQKEVKNPLGDLMLFGDLKNGGEVIFDFDKTKDSLIFSAKSMTK